jgi:hypothetical protein
MLPSQRGRMKRLLALMFMSVLCSTVVERSQAQKSNGLVKLGGIAAENGEFAILDELVTAYSAKNVRAGVGERSILKLVENDRGAVSYEIKKTGMRGVKNAVPLAMAHEFQLCDSLDQVSLPIEDGIRTLLPKGAKIKSTETLLDGRILLAYSQPGDEHYKLALSLVEDIASNGYAVVGNGTISDYGDYCGMQRMTTDVRAFLVDEPSGSSDFSAAYFFAVKERPGVKK